MQTVVLWCWVYNPSYLPENIPRVLFSDVKWPAGGADRSSPSRAKAKRF